MAPHALAKMAPNQILHVKLPDKNGNIGIVDGRFVCQCGSPGGVYSYTFCDHMAKAINENTDHQLFWDADTQELACDNLYVPLGPSIGLEFHVLFMPGGPGGASKVFSGGEFLGYFSPGEGCGVLRQIAVDYCEGRMSQAKQCTDKTHKYADQRIWDEDMKRSSSNAKIQKLCVFLTDCCRSCL